MASTATMPSHALFLAAHVAGNTGDATWDQLVSEYLALRALMDADCEFGRLFEVTDENARQHVLAESQFGKHYLSNAEARAFLSPSTELLRSEEKRWTAQYCFPLWAAAVRLAETPAPTLPAALFKVDIIRLEELWNYTAMTRDVMEIITEDMARFASLPTQTVEVRHGYPPGISTAGTALSDKPT